VVSVTARGDEAELFATHHATLVDRVTRHLRGHRDVAEEAAGLAWVQLLRCQPDRGPRLFGWLFVVAKHEAYRLLRQHARELADDHPDSRIDHTGSWEPFQRLARSEQLALIARLSARQRLALGLYVRGYSYREICGLTGKSYTWVNRHITEARAALRALVGQLDE
jgi:RNA polymerase sigma factor (sigma-70 family)